MNVFNSRTVVPSLLRISLYHVKIKHFCSSFSVTSDQYFKNKITHIKEIKDTSLKEERLSDSLADKSPQKIREKNSKIVKLWTKNWFASQNDRQPTHNDSTVGDKVNCAQISYKEKMKKYIEDYIEKNTLPDEKICLSLLYFFAKNGDIDNINVVINLYNKNSGGNYKEDYFDLFLNAALWRRGNIEKATNLFWEIYENNPGLRRKISLMLSELIAESIYGKGEAVLTFLIKFSEKFVISYGDHTLLSHVWVFCFLSDWHSDNEIALSLLEKYPKIRKYVKIQVLNLCRASLVSHKLETAHRLFEILLKYDMKKEYEIVLRSLFDYACSQRNFTACSAIIESSQQLNVSLTDVQHAKFMVLFLEKTPVIPRKIQTPQFQFKF